MTKYYNWKKEIPKAELNEVINILKRDGVIIIPTETVYGIVGNALSDTVVDRIYEAKNRPREKAINIMLGRKSDIEKYAVIENDIERKIIDKCLPGPVTVILKKKEQNFGDGFTQSDNTIGIRIPDNKIMNAILEQIDFPIIAPSANITGKASGVDAEEIAKDFDGKVDAIIDGGKAKIGLASTIVKVDNNDIKILRSGKVTLEDLKRLLNE
jgi:L-threonylcarbamoyladenylate synthase